MVFACGKCGLQYESATHKPGMTFRCSCGETIHIEQRAPLDPKVLHCSSCGAPLSKGLNTCAYCGGSVSLAEKNLDRLCPVCFTRLPSDARHCYTCGATINLIKIEGEETDKGCPRCQAKLVARRVGEHSVLECQGCGGLWLEESTFQSICAAKKAEGEIAHQLNPGLKKTHKVSREQDVQYLHCPECNAIMTRRNFAMRSGVIIDICAGHGVWLDCHELEEIVEFIQSGGFAYAQKRQAQVEAEDKRRRRERSSRMAAMGQGGAAGGDVGLFGSTGQTGYGRTAGSGQGFGGLLRFISDLLE